MGGRIGSQKTRARRIQSGHTEGGRKEMTRRRARRMITIKKSLGGKLKIKDVIRI